MPLLSDDRTAQTHAFGRVFTAGAGVSVDPALDGYLRLTACVQGLLGLAIGVEIGFFESHAADGYIEAMRFDSNIAIVTLGLEKHPLLVERLRQVSSDPYAVPSYRSRLSRTDGDCVAFRSAFLPVSREWQRPRRLPAFLGALMTGTLMARHREMTIAALRYLVTATNALNASATLQLARETNSNDAFLAAELGAIYQLQVNTSREETRKRVTEHLNYFVDATVREGNERIRSIDGDERTQAKLLEQLKTREGEWRFEVATIIERFDNASSLLTGTQT